HLEVLGFDVLMGNNRLTRFLDRADLPAHAMGDECERFLEAGVPGFPLAKTAAEFIRILSAADLALEGFAPGGSVHHTLDADTAHRTADAGETDGEDVHHEAGIDAGGDHAGAAVAANLIEISGEIGRAQLGKNHLFTGGNHADSLTDNG